MDFDLKLAFLAIGVQASFILLGLAQESLTSTEFGAEKERFSYTSSLVLVQSAGNALVALVCLLAAQGSKLSLTAGVPVRSWLLVAAGYLGAHKCGLEALRWIIFPLQVVVKSCKPIPVLFGEMLVAKTAHSRKKKLSVFLLTAGVAMFMLAKPKGKESFVLDKKTLWGLTFVVLGLVCDGFYGPLQNRIAKEHAEVSAHHLMFNLNFWQGLFALGHTLWLGEPLALQADVWVRAPSKRLTGGAAAQFLQGSYPRWRHSWRSTRLHSRTLRSSPRPWRWETCSSSRSSISMAPSW